MSERCYRTRPPRRSALSTLVRSGGRSSPPPALRSPLGASFSFAPSAWCIGSAFRRVPHRYAGRSYPRRSRLTGPRPSRPPRHRARPDYRSPYSPYSRPAPYISVTAEVCREPRPPQPPFRPPPPACALACFAPSPGGSARSLVRGRGRRPVRTRSLDPRPRPYLARYEVVVVVRPTNPRLPGPRRAGVYISIRRDSRTRLRHVTSAGAYPGLSPA